MALKVDINHIIAISFAEHPPSGDTLPVFVIERCDMVDLRGVDAKRYINHIEGIKSSVCSVFKSNALDGSEHGISMSTLNMRDSNYFVMVLARPGGRGVTRQKDYVELEGLLCGSLHEKIGIPNGEDGTDTIRWVMRGEPEFDRFIAEVERLGDERGEGDGCARIWVDSMECYLSANMYGAKYIFLDDSWREFQAGNLEWESKENGQ